MKREGPREIGIGLGRVLLSGLLRTFPEQAGVVLFAHGSGSGRHSPRNNYVADVLRSAGVGSLLFDLLTEEEEFVDSQTAALRFDIPLLTRRLVDVTHWTLRQDWLGGRPIGYFGASTGAAAALAAAAVVPQVAAVVSRGGRPDLAGDALPQVRAPTLLIVGGEDHQVLALNSAARARMTCESRLAVVPGATHLFEEPGTLEQVAGLAADWFASHLAPAPASGMDHRRRPGKL